MNGWQIHFEALDDGVLQTGFGNRSCSLAAFLAAF